MEYTYLSAALLRPLLEVTGPDFLNTQTKAPELQSLIKQIREPDARLGKEESNRLINHLINYSRDEALCVQSASKRNAHSHCSLQHLLLCCNTLREALYYLEKFSVLLSDHLEIQITRTRDDIIRIKLPVGDHFIIASERHYSEMIISTLLLWIRQLCGHELVIRDIHLPFPAPQYKDVYEKAWQTKVIFSSDECCLQFDGKWMDAGLHNTNPHILKMMKREVEDQYRKLARSGSLAERIRKALIQNKLRLNANQQEVADYFHISARTLNRHLHKEDTSLKQIVTNVRVEIAKRMLLSSGDSIEQIALNIGLSGRRTLDRIFIKETQQSPAQFRQAKRNMPMMASA